MGSTLQLAQSEHCPAVTNISSQPVLSCQNKNTTTMSPVKQNFHQDSEALINKQINMELYASYVYLSMSAYLPGMPSPSMASPSGSAPPLPRRRSTRRRIDYQVMRGGRVLFREIAKPSTDEWGTAMDAIQASLELERTVNQALLDMHKSAGDNNDAQMTDFLEGTFLNEQVEATKEIADLVTKMKRAGDGLGLHIIDKELLS